ncbi:hypothetical protein BDV10DRAFT_3250 [Aspergillus recurvatus]
MMLQESPNGFWGISLTCNEGSKRACASTIIKISEGQRKTSLKMTYLGNNSFQLSRIRRWLWGWISAAADPERRLLNRFHSNNTRSAGFICQCHEDQRSQYQHQTLSTVQDPTVGILECRGNLREERCQCRLIRELTCLVTIFLCSVLLTGGNQNCTIVMGFCAF